MLPHSSADEVFDISDDDDDGLIDITDDNTSVISISDNSEDADYARPRSVIDISSDSESSISKPTPLKCEQSLPRPSEMVPLPHSHATGVPDRPSQPQPHSPSLASATLSPSPDLVGTIFESLELAKETIYAYQEAKGFKFVHGQSKRDDQGELRKLMLRCTSTGAPRHTHNPAIDPADHRKGRTIRTGCGALANLNRVRDTNYFILSSAVWEHNHLGLPKGARVLRPPNEQQKIFVADLIGKGRFQRRQLKHALAVSSIPGRPLEERQISNIVNNLHDAANKHVSLYCYHRILLCS